MNIEEVLALSQKYEALGADRILLSGQVSKEVEIRRAVATQVALSSALERKLPTWAKQGVYIPRHLNLEQASSEETARYKQRFIHEGERLLDLTGGMGVDFWAMATCAEHSVYTEQDTLLYEASLYNLSRLLPKGVFTSVQGDSMAQFEELLATHHPTLIYLDPARRADRQESKRVYAIEDCSPSLFDVISRLKASTASPIPRLLVKLSPMLDVKYCLSTLEGLRTLSIVSYKSEVKELLLEINLQGDNLAPEQIPLRAINLLGYNRLQIFEGIWQDEAVPCTMAQSLGRYLYEPNSAVMKLGLFNYVARHFNLNKLHQHTHLYTSNIYIPDFPGRTFEIKTSYPYQAKVIKGLHKSIPGAQITCRNFPLSAEQLRQKLKIKEDSATTLFATRLWDETYTLILCGKANTP